MEETLVVRLDLDITPALQKLEELERRMDKISQQRKQLEKDGAGRD